MNSEVELQIRLKGNKILKQTVLQSRDLTDLEKVMFYSQVLHNIRDLKCRQIERLTEEKCFS